ncbi:MAG TPA: NADH-quinone oxidoreductase subunit N [Candidatus Tumulicola sp.]|nr:NADH-quinone oxidoreductase subunit N [Candidatus Tumulicola sp.]
MTVTFTAADWASIVPIGVVAVTGLVVLLADLFARRSLPRYVSIGIGVAGGIAAMVLAGRQFGHEYAAFFGGFVTGGFTTVFQEIVLLALIGSLILYAAIGPLERMAGTAALMLWSTCGALLMAGAANLMTIFLGLELLSLALYCLCGLVDRATARESALKYLILSSTASGFLLFGMALLFGATGSVMLADFVAPALSVDPVFWMGAGMFAVGLAFKLSLVPFHTWAPDVYEGAPLPVTAFMSVATKAAVLAVFARFVYAALPSAAADRLLLPMWIVAGISMILGNAGMLAQHDLKRLLAYSGVAQVGYILTALAGGTPLGLRYAIYYLAAYTFMNLGAFAVASALSNEGEQGSHLANYAGLARRRPWLAAAMTVFLLALAGLPPTAGFLGKILILSSSVGAGYAWMAALLIAGTAISLYAYAKVIFAMYGRARHETRDVKPFVPLAWASAALCAAAVVVMTFYPLTPSNVLPLVK